MVEEVKQKCSCYQINSRKHQHSHLQNLGERALSDSVNDSVNRVKSLSADS